MEKKYSKAAREKIGEVMKEFKKGRLKSSSGHKVKDRKQAIAIGIYEARDAGLKTPNKKKGRRKRKPEPASNFFQ